MFVKGMFAAAALCILSAQAASADLRACNRTDKIVSVAIGYSVGDDWVSRGWWTMRPGDCSTMLSGTLKNRYYYWRGTYSGGALPSGDYSFCTSKKKFEIIGDEDCSVRGFDTSKFSEVDTGDATSHTIALTMPGQATPPATGGGKPRDDGAGGMQATLAGSWVLTSDPNFKMTFIADKFAVKVDGMGGESGTVRHQETCPESEGDGPVILMVPTSDHNQTVCLLVVNASRDRLELYDYSAGADLVFVRP